MNRITVAIFSFMLLAKCMFSQNRHNDSISAIIKGAKNDTVIVNLYLTISEPLYKTNADSALKIFNITREICEKNLKKKIPNYEIGFYKNALGQVSNGIGYLNKNNGKIAEAMSAYEKAEEAFSSINQADGLANTYNNFGVLYKSLGNYPKAIDYYRKALKINESSGNKKQQATTLNNLGVIYRETDNIDEAISYYNQSLQLANELNSKSDIATSFNNIGMAYRIKGDTSKALDYFFKALKFAEESKDSKKAALVYNNIGTVYTNRNRFEEAIQMYNKSSELYEAVKSKSGLSNNYNNLGTLYSKMGKSDEAMKWFLKALVIAKESSFPKEISNVAKNLKKLYEKKGMFKEALEMYELFVSMHDSILNTENQKMLAQSQYKYEYEKKVATDSIRRVEEKKGVALQLKQEETKRYALYGGIFLVLIFAAFMFNRFRVEKQQKTLIAHQKKIVEEKQKEIVDSINYAKRIQQSWMPTEKYIAKNISKGDEKRK